MSVLDNIDTIVILMMENRSFDHLLGALSLPGFGDRADIDGLHGPIDESGFIRNRAYKNHEHETRYGPYYPFIQSDDYQPPTDLPHDRAGTIAQFGRNKALLGKYLMNRFAECYNLEHPGHSTVRNPAMAIYDPRAVPMTTFLAQNFTVCNRWFASIPAHTHPNRLMGMCGYSHIDNNCWSLSSLHNPRKGVYPDHRFYFDWLDEIGVSWRVYHQGFSFVTMVRPSVVSHDNFRRLGISSSKYRNTLERDFMQEDHLPQVIFVEPGFIDDITEPNPNCNHPTLSMTPGERFVRDIYRAVTCNPTRWRKTVFIVYYDEHGGFFDHVPPITLDTQPGKPGDFEPFAISGARVPAFIVSPYAEVGVCNSNLDHTSILRLLAEKFTPGQPYSDVVDERHKQPEAKLESVLAGLTRTTPRTDIPVAPPIPKGPKSTTVKSTTAKISESPDDGTGAQLSSLRGPVLRPANNEAEKAFLRTYEILLREFGDELRRTFPDRMPVEESDS